MKKTYFLFPQTYYEIWQNECYDKNSRPWKLDQVNIRGRTTVTTNTDALREKYISRTLYTTRIKMKGYIYTVCVIGLCAYTLGSEEAKKPVENKPVSEDSKNQEKRGIFGTGYGYGSEYETSGHGFQHEEGKLLSKTIIKEIAQPYPVE
ncbi:Hypothetical protein CINCED_3A006382, partial [Cinara cedri]